MRIAILRITGVTMHRRRETMVQFLKERGHEVRFFDVRFMSTGPVALRAASARLERNRVRRVLADYAPDTLITFEPEGLFAMKSTTAKVRLYDVEEFHGATTHSGKARKDWVAREHRAARPHLTGVSYLSRWMQDYFGEDFEDVPGLIVSNALAARSGHDDGSLRDMAGLSASDHILLYHGYFKPGRGLEWLAGLGDILPDRWNIVFMGHGEHEAAIRKAAKGRVTVLPPVSEDRLPNVIAGASLGAILYDNTSLNHTYSTPNKLYQLPAAGVPIWAEDLPALKAQVEEAQIGWVLPKSANMDSIHALLKEAEARETTDHVRAWFEALDKQAIEDAWVELVETSQAQRARKRAGNAGS